MGNLSCRRGIYESHPPAIPPEGCAPPAGARGPWGLLVRALVPCLGDGRSKRVGCWWLVVVAGERVECAPLLVVSCYSVAAILRSRCTVVGV